MYLGSPQLGQVLTKFNPKMQDFKRVFGLACNKGRTKQLELFNWFSNLKNVWFFQKAQKTCEM